MASTDAGPSAALAGDRNYPLEPTTTLTAAGSAHPLSPSADHSTLSSSFTQTNHQDESSESTITSPDGRGFEEADEDAEDDYPSQRSGPSTRYEPHRTGSKRLSHSPSTERLTGTAGSRSWNGTKKPAGGNYPADEDDEAEETSVKQNLERWAAEERQRRRALRSSRSGSLTVPPSASSFVRRLSVLRGSGSKASLAGDSSTDARKLSSTNTSGDLLGNGGRPGSISSIETTSSTGNPRGADLRANGYAAAHSTESPPLEDVPEADGDSDLGRGLYSYQRSASKGKQRAVQDPFSDDGDIRRKGSIKPTATRPIVTVGRASSLAARHGIANAPAIVATDVDAEKALRDPFASSRDGRTAAAYSMTPGGRLYGISANRENRTIHEGEPDEEARAEDAVGRNSGPLGDEGRPAPARKSTSDSRFNEVGLDDEDVDAEERRMEEEREREWRKENDRDREARNRGTWWTDWLCGCGGPVDDEEQAGKTMPDLSG